MNVTKSMGFGLVDLRALMILRSPSLLHCLHVTRLAPPWELSSAEGADGGLRQRYAQYLDTRVQGVAQPLTPLLDHWVALTSHPMVLRVIRHGHEIPFKAMGPPPFNGVLNSIPTDPAETQILRRELEEMVAKGAVTRVPDYLAHKGYYSRYFLVPKRDGGR